MIVLKDNASDNYTYGIPEQEDAPQVIFTSLEDVKVSIRITSYPSHMVRHFHMTPLPSSSSLKKSLLRPMDGARLSQMKSPIAFVLACSV